MSLDQDVAAAHRAVDELEQACTQVMGHFGDTVDSRRLRVDVNRLRDDLNLLCGARAAAHAQASPYAAGVWDDGFDPGAGASSRTTS